MDFFYQTRSFLFAAATIIVDNSTSQNCLTTEENLQRKRREESNIKLFVLCDKRDKKRVLLLSWQMNGSKSLKYFNCALQLFSWRRIILSKDSKIHTNMEQFGFLQWKYRSKLMAHMWHRYGCWYNYFRLFHALEHLPTFYISYLLAVCMIMLHFFDRMKRDMLTFFISFSEDAKTFHVVVI